MTIRPILFSGPMVRALLDGRKTQTRRVLNPQPNVLNGGKPMNNGRGSYSTENGWKRYTFAVGDLLYVRETHAILPAFAEGEEPTCIQKEGWPNRSPATVIHKWKPGIHMPRQFSRLTLKVTDVRVQRLQDIDSTDALAEGIERQDPTPDDWEWYRGWAEEHGLDPSDPDGMRAVWIAPGTCQGFGPRKDDPQWGPTPEFAFRCLWDSLNEKRGFGWQVNPWVVAVTFDVHRVNVDQFKEEVAA